MAPLGQAAIKPLTNEDHRPAAQRCPPGDDRRLYKRRRHVRHQAEHTLAADALLRECCRESLGAGLFTEQETLWGTLSLLL
jgi:hypothetical protein